MKRSITAYEAPALVDAHGGLTRLALYERLSETGGSNPQPGLSAAIADDVVGFAANGQGWNPPVRRDGGFDAVPDGALRGHARFWTSQDADGPFAIAFFHVAAYLFSSRWRRAGAPPEDHAIQAQWTMMAAGMDRLAIVALADRTPEIFWVDSDPSMRARLAAGAADMERRLEAKDPPPVDAETAPATEPVADAAGEVDPSSAHAEWRAARTERSAARNRVQFADHAFDAAEKRLSSAIAPGASHVHEGYRVTRSAKTDKLTEEKIDAVHF